MTRDPKRIERMLAALREAWYAHPDLRLGQLVSNAAGFDPVGDGKQEDPFYVEDDEMEDSLRLYARVERVQQKLKVDDE